MPLRVDIGSVEIINNISGSVHIEGGTLGGISSITSIQGGTISLSSTGGSAVTPSGVINILSTSTTLFSANTNRKYASMTNYAGTPIYLSFGGVAGTSRGARVEATGGVYEINQTNLWRGTVTAITAGASGTSTIGITEWD